MFILESVTIEFAACSHSIFGGIWRAGSNTMARENNALADFGC